MKTTSSNDLAVATRKTTIAHDSERSDEEDRHDDDNHVGNPTTIVVMVVALGVGAGCVGAVFI